MTLANKHKNMEINVRWHSNLKSLVVFFCKRNGYTERNRLKLHILSLLLICSMFSFCKLCLFVFCFAWTVFFSLLCIRCTSVRIQLGTDFSSNPLIHIFLICVHHRRLVKLVSSPRKPFSYHIFNAKILFF